MIIPNGITNGSSNRFGFLIGSQRNPRWGMQFGYFHDPTSIPFGDILNLKWDNSSNKCFAGYTLRPLDGTTDTVTVEGEAKGFFKTSFWNSFFKNSFDSKETLETPFLN